MNPSFLRFLSKKQLTIGSKALDVNIEKPTQKISIKDNLKSTPDISVVINDILSTSLTSNELVRKLVSFGFRPDLAQDENEFTGSLKIIRLQNPPAKTRYFHAQFFSHGDGEDKLQHLSFDYVGGPENFQKISNELVANIDGVKDLSVSKEGYKLYHIARDYVLWMKLFTRDDYEKLKNDPYKVYKTSDIGQLIRVAVEEEIH